MLPDGLPEIVSINISLVLRASIASDGLRNFMIQPSPLPPLNRWEIGLT